MVRKTLTTNRPDAEQLTGPVSGLIELPEGMEEGDRGRDERITHRRHAVAKIGDARDQFSQLVVRGGSEASVGGTRFQFSGT
jgi:hypothetical protein